MRGNARQQHATAALWRRRRAAHESPLTTHHSPAWLRRFRTALSRWYARHARDLPWRQTRDPYRVWISEIMLQQTTVAAVVPYYDRFLAKFPTVERLAAAAEQDVLKLWEGLGYYSRARNLHAAARQIVSEHEGEFPAEVEGLLSLPGVGRYTAGAIASFAFDRRAPIVEANTLRLYSRLLGYRGDPRSAEGQELLWDFAERILPRRAPGRFNQALMELGATICTPADPACESCPVRMCCRALAIGAQAEIPQPRPRPDVTHVVEACVAVRNRGRYLLRRRGESERWAGLWDFPRVELNGHATAAEYAARNSEITPEMQRHLGQTVRSLTGIDSEVDRLLTEIRHSVTRFRIRLLCFEAVHRGGRLSGQAESLRWVRPDELEHVPLSVSGRKLARLLAGRRD
jgi:A/G-specific adenine glycosylase